MILKCSRKICGNKWDYKGKNHFYASCPQCKTSVKITKKVGVKK